MKGDKNEIIEYEIIVILGWSNHQHQCPMSWHLGKISLFSLFACIHLKSVQVANTIELNKQKNESI